MTKPKKPITVLEPDPNAPLIQAARRAETLIEAGFADQLSFKAKGIKEMVRKQTKARKPDKT